MSSHWNKNIPEPVNLQDVILEELAKNAQEKENRKYGVFAFSTQEEIDISATVSQHKEQLNSDGKFAKMLQQQYSAGYCEVVEKDKQGVSFTALSFDLDDIDSDYEELEDTQDVKEWNKCANVIKEFDPIPAYNTGQRKQD